MPKGLPEKDAPRDLPSLMRELGILAQQRAQLFSAEAKIWTELGHLLSETSLRDIVQPMAEPETLKSGIDPETLLAVPPAAEYLGLSKQTLNSWRITGAGPEFIRLGRRIFYRRAVLDRYIAQHTYPHTSAYPSQKKGAGRLP